MGGHGKYFDLGMTLVDQGKGSAAFSIGKRVAKQNKIDWHLAQQPLGVKVSQRTAYMKTGLFEHHASGFEQSIVDSEDKNCFVLRYFSICGGRVHELPQFIRQGHDDSGSLLKIFCGEVVEIVKTFVSRNSGRATRERLECCCGTQVLVAQPNAKEVDPQQRACGSL
ncbi:MAG: hypothetical protein ACRYFU_12475 [Janthinobacterium lividum]